MALEYASDVSARAPPARTVLVVRSLVRCALLASTPRPPARASAVGCAPRRLAEAALARFPPPWR